MNITKIRTDSIKKCLLKVNIKKTNTTIRMQFFKLCNKSFFELINLKMTFRKRNS
jgi:hypothetical protein